MPYQDHQWACAGLPMRWRVAELYARLSIGFVWGFAMWILLALLFGYHYPWATIALLALLGWGFEMALPSLKED